MAFQILQPHRLVTPLTTILRRLRRKGASLLGRSDGPGLPPVKSDFLSWLGYANAGMLNKGNVACFQYVLTHLPGPQPLVEIGSFCGLSTNVIGHLKERNGISNRLITCDRWIFEGSEAGGLLGESRSITHEEYRDFVRETFIRNVSFFSASDLPYTVEVFSDEFFRLWQEAATVQDVFGRELTLGGGIAFAYIDGNHSYEFARRDFENVDHHLVPGGFVLFDDSGDGSGWEVCRVVEEIKRSGTYDLIDHSPNYLFRKR